MARKVTSGGTVGTLAEDARCEARRDSELGTLHANGRARAVQRGLDEFFWRNVSSRIRWAENNSLVRRHEYEGERGEGTKRCWGTPNNEVALPIRTPRNVECIWSAEIYPV